MLLSEVQDGTKVQLVVQMGERHFEFETTLVTRHKKDIFFEPIRKGNKLLNVDDKGVDTSIMLVRKDEKPVMWQGVNVNCVRYKGVVYYAVSANAVGKEFNRRGAYRMFIGESLDAKIGMGKSSLLEVILKDLSNSGFAFIYPEEIEEENPFVFMKYVAKLGENVRELPLYGKVVRKMTLQDGRFLYGCALVKKDDNIGHYINQKQMEQLAKKNESYADKQKKNKK